MINHTGIPTRFVISVNDWLDGINYHNSIINGPYCQGGNDPSGVAASGRYAKGYVGELAVTRYLDAMGIYYEHQFRHDPDPVDITVIYKGAPLTIDVKAMFTSDVGVTKYAHSKEKTADLYWFVGLDFFDGTASNGDMLGYISAHRFDTIKTGAGVWWNIPADCLSPVTWFGHDGFKRRYMS